MDVLLVHNNRCTSQNQRVKMVTRRRVLDEGGVSFKVGELKCGNLIKNCDTGVLYVVIAMQEYANVFGEMFLRVNAFNLQRSRYIKELFVCSEHYVPTFPTYVLLAEVDSMEGALV